jgi:hypothetical protein
MCSGRHLSRAPTTHCYHRLDVEDSILVLLRRAVSSSPGLFVAWNPGSEYVEQHPYCITLRRLLGVPNDATMLSSLAADGVVSGAGNGRGIEALLKQRGVLVTLYGTEGSNFETRAPIKWLKLGGETVEPLHRTPADQMAARRVVPAAVRDFIRNGGDGGDGGARRVSVDPVVRHRGIPAQVLVTLHDGIGGPAPDADDADDRSYVMANLYERMRHVDAQGATILILQRKFLRGGRGKVVLVQRAQHAGGASRQTGWRRARGLQVFVRAGCSDEEAAALLARVARRSDAFKEVEQMLADKGSDAQLTFTDAESKYIYNLVATKSMYRELSSVLREK